MAPPLQNHRHTDTGVDEVVADVAEDDVAEVGGSNGLGKGKRRKWASTKLVGFVSG